MIFLEETIFEKEIQCFWFARRGLCTSAALQGTPRARLCFVKGMFVFLGSTSVFCLFVWRFLNFVVFLGCFVLLGALCFLCRFLAFLRLTSWLQWCKQIRQNAALLFFCFFFWGGGRSLDQSIFAFSKGDSMRGTERIYPPSGTCRSLKQQ